MKNKYFTFHLILMGVKEILKSNQLLPKLSGNIIKNLKLKKKKKGKKKVCLCFLGSGSFSKKKRLLKTF